MKKILVILMVILSLVNGIIVKGTTATTTNTITETREVIETSTIKALQVTYITLPVYGSKLVTNYIAVTEMYTIEGHEAYQKTNKLMKTYSDATLQNENGFVLSYGWEWNIKEVKTTVNTVKTVTYTREIATTTTTISYGYLEVNAIGTTLRISGLDKLADNTLFVNNYNSIILTPERFERNKEYRSLSVEDG